MLTPRTAIINQHLKGEVYDETVSVTKLAACTSLFSGSDLRHLVHSAALEALKDSTPTSWQIQYGADGVPIPESSRTPLASRVIQGRHFDRAQKLVSASSATNRKELDELRRWAKESFQSEYRSAS
jgi:SpoVK/Ycf46/Vps4 family AAA+-type ATPase